ncbi:MAG: hypothetical protein PHE32_01285 [Candidatus Shapirobacteria bacterium]|nr:hypothetical protein [Candidatus Shapirobacteria bacterium]
MENNNKILKILIPIIAVVIIFESVMLVSGLEKSNIVTKESTGSAETKKEEVVVGNAFDLVFSTDSKEMKVDKNYQIKLQGLVKEKNTLDAIDISIKYDAKNLDITNLVFDEKLPKPFIGQIIKEDGMIVVKYLIETKQGMTFNVNDVVSLVSFNVKTRVAGNYEFEVATGNEDKKFATMFIENTSAKALPFSGNKLEINVIK